MRHMLLAATALAMLSGTTYAQESVSGSNSTTTVNTSSGSTSQSISNPRVNVIGNPIGNGASSSYSGAKSSSNSRSNSRSASVGNASNVTVNTYAGVEGYGNNGSGGGGSSGTAGDPSGYQYIGYGGGYTLRNTPEVIPPNVVGGNPCAVGASGGVSAPGFGLALGATWADKACERRQQAALLFNMGEQKVALELMCQDDNVRTAMRVGGKPCLADPAAAAAAAPVAVPVAQASAARPLPAATAAPPKPARPEWCYTASPAEQRAHPACDLKS